MVSDSSGIGNKLRVAVVDAQPLFRAGVSHVLRACREIELVAEGASATDALHIAGRHLLDIIVLDLQLPGGGQALSSITRMWPAIRLVVLTASEFEADVSAALQIGARGYILKAVSEQELIRALHSVANGEVYLTASLGARLFAHSKRSNGPARPSPAFEDVDLTPREFEILEQVSNGSTNKEVARSLSISEKTVKYYMTNIMAKLHVRNRVEAVVAVRDRMRKSA